MSSGGSNISTTGAVIGGSVQTARDFIGRDQLNIAIHLQNVNEAAEVVRTISAAAGAGDLDSTVISAQMLALMVELRKTHSTLVALISPLRRIDDQAATFPQQFQSVYNDFRDAYDGYDFFEERTHCTRVARLAWRLKRHNSPITQTPDWAQLDQALSVLGNADTDIIEAYYVPFLQNFNRVMVEIDRLVGQGKIEEAITLKEEFLGELDPQYNAIKDVLKLMTNTIGDIEALLA
jgi:hypothetical protein